MRLWQPPWRREVAPPRVEYVPVVLPDARPALQRWQDAEYLRAVAGFAGNSTFLLEVSDALAACREAADRAGSPDELRGVQVGVRVLRELLTMSARARAALNDVREREGAGREYDNCQLG